MRLRAADPRATRSTVNLPTPRPPRELLPRVLRRNPATYLRRLLPVFFGLLLILCLPLLRSGMGKNKVLVHGARRLSQFYFSDELAERLGQNYHRCCTAESDPSIYAGRVTGFLAEQDSLPQDQRYYICGQATMAVETRDLLIEKGIPFGNIITEIYF